MVVVMVSGASEKQVEKVEACVEGAGLTAHLAFGDQRTIVGVIGDKTAMMRLPLAWACLGLVLCSGQLLPAQAAEAFPGLEESQWK